MKTEATFRTRMQRLEGLLEEVESAKGTSAQSTREIVRVLMEFHGEALTALLEHVADSPVGGQELIDRLGRDEMISSLLVLYGLHPLSMQSRVIGALERVRPYLATHKGDVELLGVDEASGVVHLRLQGSCEGCPSSRATLKGTIEEAIYAAAPDVAAIEVEGAAEEEGVSESAPAHPNGREVGFVPVSEIRYTACPIPAATL